MTLGEKIRAAREQLGWDQSDLSKALAVEPPTVSRWENDVIRPRAKRLKAIADLLKKPVAWFQEKAPGMGDIEKRLTALESTNETLTPLELELINAFRAAGSKRTYLTAIQNAALPAVDKKQRRPTR